MNWKIIGIICLTLFLAENFLLGYFIYAGYVENGKMLECYYNFCSGYDDAWYEGSVCSCYESDLLGNSIVAKETIIK